MNVADMLNFKGIPETPVFKIRKAKSPVTVEEATRRQKETCRRRSLAFWRSVFRYLPTGATPEVLSAKSGKTPCAVGYAMRRFMAETPPLVERKGGNHNPVWKWVGG